MNESTAPKFNDTMTDIALALISLHEATQQGLRDDDIAEIVTDIEKSLAELEPAENADLAPKIRSLTSKLETR
jgi:hypothetical protein